MKLKRYKETDIKRTGIILFTISCILLISGVILYRTFAIFQVDTTQNMIEGNIQDEGDIRFMVYIDDVLQKDVPNKESGYSLDTSTSYCENGSIVSWDDENWEVRLKNISTTKTKCYLKFKQIYKEEILNGAIPDLGNGRLIPVKISDIEKPSDITYAGAQAGKVTKADITSEWYNYSNQQWANAVILRDGKVNDYKPGDEIKESDIESYFVWIPRYRYKLKESEVAYDGYTTATAVGVEQNNQNIPGTFKITFETKDSGIQNGTTQESEHTHPAFTAFDSNGFWVGKFETGYNQNADNNNVTPVVTTWNKTGAEINDDKGEKVIIKPHIYSWRNINVSNAFYTSYHYQRDLESHMMKNTEWGAVAYLTQSQYGKCPSGNCTEINMNNSESYITGMSTILAPTCGYTGSSTECNYYGGPKNLNDLDSGNIKNYYQTESQGGSTTGNYYGVYDMAGGAWDYVMGVIHSTDSDTSAPASGRNALSNSNFKGPYSCPTCDEQNDKENTTGKSWPSKKYYDLYDYKTTDQEYQRGKLGDATKEVGPFVQGTGRYTSSYYGDLATFAYFNWPWFGRGGSCDDGTEAGIFAFGHYAGNTNIYTSFRIVLTP